MSHPFEIGRLLPALATLTLLLTDGCGSDAYDGAWNDAGLSGADVRPLPLPSASSLWRPGDEPMPGGPEQPEPSYEDLEVASAHCGFGFGEPERCDGRDNDCDGLADEGCAFTWINFSATAAEIEGLPSVEYHSDTRAGSAQIDFNGGYRAAMDEEDPSFTAAMLILRNGLGEVVEAAQLNRGFVPYQLDDEGYQIQPPPPVRWLWAPTEGYQTVSVPYRVLTGSNAGFDLSDERVSVRARTEMAFDGADPVDNSHQFVEVFWTTPRGPRTARLQLRARYDWNGDGLDDGDTWVPLYRYAWGGDGEDLTTEAVEWAKETESFVMVRVNVQVAHDFVRLHYDDANYFTRETLPPALD